MTDIVKRLRRRYFSPVAVFRNPDGPEAADEIERLRADLLKAEIQTEIEGLENILRAVARGRREGIEACLVVLERWGAWSAGPDDYGMPPDVERLTEAHAAISALLEDER